jgi:4-amino-4-deoxy-L-arabinose transferase
VAPAVAYLVLVASVYGLGAAMWGRRTGWAAALVYATCPFAVVAANSVSTDPFLAMWEALTALAYWKALRAAQGTAGSAARRDMSSRWIVLLWLLAGLGFLTKGPPALLTLLVIFIYHGWRVATRRPVPALSSPVGIPLFAVVAFGWFVVVGFMHEGLLQELIREEVVGRVADPTLNRNPQWYGPFVVLLLPLVLGLGPWLALWPHAWSRALAWSGWSTRLREVAARDALFFCLLWALVPLAVLFTSRSRLPLYVLPFLPALALLTGRAVVSRAAATGNTVRAIRIAVVTAAVMLAVKGGSSYVDSRSDMRPLFKAVQSSGCDMERVYAYGLRKEYGLMFYLDGKMTRVSADPVQPYAAMGAAELVAELSGPEREESACVVTKARYVELPALLEEAGLTFATTEVGEYAVLAVRP